MDINKVIFKLKQTSLGSGASWLLRPIKHYNDVKYHLEKQLPYPPSNQQIRWCFWDHFKFRVRYKGNLATDYFGAQMYRKSDFVRKESMAHGVRFKWRDSIQAKKDWAVFSNKHEFYKAYSDFLNRKWLCADKNTSLDEIKSFAQSCSNEIFVKSLFGCGGKEVFLVKINSEQDLIQLYELCVKQPMLLEERLEQCSEIHSFSDGAINTFRIITIIDKNGNAVVARAELRMGRKGMAIDNYCSGGLAAQIDIQSGVIFSMGKDENGKEYIFHPDTNKQIVGFTVPDWDGYKEFVCSLAAMYPEMRYVGWDVIKDSKGRFCVIEGNKDAGVGALESGLLNGLKPCYDAILNAEAPYPYYR